MRIERLRNFNFCSDKCLGDLLFSVHPFFSSYHYSFFYFKKVEKYSRVINNTSFLPIVFIVSPSSCLLSPPIKKEKKKICSSCHSRSHARTASPRARNDRRLLANPTLFFRKWPGDYHRVAYLYYAPAGSSLPVSRSE